MAQECGFFNAQMVGEEYDRVYLAEQFAAYFASFIGNGIYGKSMQQLQVLSQDVQDMSIKVLSGQAWTNGWWYRNTDVYNIQIPIADGVLSRIDVIVVRWGKAERDMWLHLIMGTPSQNPVKPSIRRDNDYYDLQLAIINVSAGIINIKQSNIIDTRLDNSVCGLVTGVVDQIDTTNLYNQFTAYFNEFKQKHEADFDEWSEEQKQEYLTYIAQQKGLYDKYIADTQNDYDNWTNEKREDFEDWFENMKDQLSTDAAGNLQLQINKCSRPRGIFTGNIDELKTIDDVGFYWVSNNTAAGTHPTLYNTYYLLEVCVSSNGSAVVQRASISSNCQIYERMYKVSYGAWYDWYNASNAHMLLTQYILDGNTYGNSESLEDIKTGGVKLKDIVYGYDKFVAVGNTLNAQIIYSYDGKKWAKAIFDRTTDSFAPRTYLSSIAYGNGVYIAVGYFQGTSTYIVYKSTDGINWVHKVLPEAIAVDNLTFSVAFGNGTFVIADAACTYTSVDGENWVKHSISFMSRTKVMFARYRFYTNSGYTSTDGINWVSAGTNALITSIISVVNGYEMYVAVGMYNGSPRMLYSHNGTYWMVVSSVQLPGNVSTIAFEQRTFVTSSNGLILYSLWSPDKVLKFTVATMAGPTYNKFAYDSRNGMLVMISNELAIRTGYIYFARSDDDVAHTIDAIYDYAVGVDRYTRYRQYENSLKFNEIYAILEENGMIPKEEII